jgi:uncharacterized protein GlcG (DUF336 family)
VEAAVPVLSPFLNAVLGVALAVTAAQAQAPPAPATTPAAANPFPLDLALEASQAALAFCKANNALAVVEVMDTAMNPKVVLAADGARGNFVELARRKAYTVLKSGMSSGDFGKSVGPQVRGGPPINGDPNLIGFAGALPIKIGDEIVAAISVSGPTGADNDEACARAGLEKIKDRLK